MRKWQLGVLGVLAALAVNPVLAQDQAPAWLRRPTGDDFEAVWPRKAFKEGRGGKATIGCVVTVHGALRDCKVLEEEPADAGFGGAGLALTPQFLMRPALKDGKPIETYVRIPLNFPSFAPYNNIRVNDRSGLVHSQLPWRRAPTYAEVLAAYPAKARAQKTGGMATLDCKIEKDGRLRECRVLREAPKGMGFAGAARSLSTLFVTPTATNKGESIAGSRAHVNITFAADALDSSSPVIGKPKWSRVPAVNDLAAVMPSEARKAKVYKSRVVMTCKVVADGAVEGCRVDSEDPAGLGYGQAALKLTPYFGLAVWSDEGLPTIGGSVTIPLRFDLESAVAAAEAAPKP